MLYDSVIAPFVEFEFMRRAFIGTLALAIGAGPVGVRGRPCRFYCEPSNPSCRTNVPHFSVSALM